MITQVVSRFISANKKFYSNKFKGYKSPKKTILVNVCFLDPFAVISSLKIAAAVSEILGGQLHVIPHFKADKQLRSMIKSFLPKKIFSVKYLLIRAFFENFFHILRVVKNLKSGQDVESLKDDRLEIGLHIYDSILARMKVSTIEKLSFKYKLQITFDLSYYFSLKNLFDKERVDFVVLPDNTYRDGLVYELIKLKKIPCIVGIDLNGISMHKNITLSDFNEHCRTPDNELINELMLKSKALHLAEEYASLRFSGKEMQHDTMRAFSANKLSISRKILCQDYDLLPNKKIVLVMAHVFSDAPHALPGMLFRDFEKWLVETCIRLSGNQNIEFIVKEHPSASLYGEDRFAATILDKIGLKHKLLADNIHTRSLFDCIDVMVTCGGTGGMEFPCFGVPVLVAARPAYSNFSYIVHPKTQPLYFLEIDKLQDYKRLNEEQILTAKIVLFVINFLMKLPKKYIGLGSQEFYRGINFDLNLFLEEMIIDCHSSAGYNLLLNYIEHFLNGKYKNLYKSDVSLA